jgi:hypothetical protein
MDLRAILPGSTWLIVTNVRSISLQGLCGAQHTLRGW